MSDILNTIGYGGNTLLYNILMALLFLGTLFFLLYIIIDNKRNYDDYESKKRLIIIANRKYKKDGGVGINTIPYKGYNRFNKL